MQTQINEFLFEFLNLTDDRRDHDMRLDDDLSVSEGDAEFSYLKAQDTWTLE